MSTLITVAAIKRVCNPFRTSPWTRRVTRNMVAACLAANDLYARPLQGNPDVAPELHASRIAYFVRHGWDDAIGVDVGVPELGCQVAWPVMDGNHRLAAAIYRNDPCILADIDGSVQFAAELFGAKA